MVFESDRAVKMLIPAVRIAVADSLSKDYSMNQESIAKSLDITQAAVNKYLKKRYSKGTAALIELIKEKGFDRKIARMVIERKDISEINREIDKVASDSRVIDNALKVLM